MSPNYALYCHINHHASVCNCDICTCTAVLPVFKVLQNDIATSWEQIQGYIYSNMQVTY